MEYVCPNCGAPPRGASVCANCGLDLDSLGELPTREVYEAGGFEVVAAEHAALVQAQAGEPGGLISRAVAHVIDNVVALGAPVIAGLVAYAIAGEDAGYAVGGMSYIAGVFFYAPVLLAFNDGRTLGKQALGIRVRNRSGSKIGLGRAFLRESVVKALLGMTLVGLVASALVALLSADRRSLHDRTMGTEVVTTG